MSRRKTNEEFLKEVHEKNEYVKRGEIEILSNYVDSNTKIICRCVKHNYTYSVAPSSLRCNIGCKKCGRERTTEKQMKPHEKFVEEVNALDPTTTVIGIYSGAFTPIDFLCKNKHIYKMRPMSFLNGYRCPYCSNRKVLIGYNDIETTRPDVAKLFTNQENIYKYTSQSREKINFTCPWCGKIQAKHIYAISECGFSCKYCSNNISYPNKFGRALFDQLLADNYEAEWQPEWAKPYSYDFYFELNADKYIVEFDGAFHFEKDEKFGKTLEERQNRDKVKNELAYSHGIHMIRINCIESKCDFIKNNIITSELNNLFDLSNIDWKQCNEKAHSNFVKEACNLYMNVSKDYNYIAKALHIGESTARQYIRKGIELGWCDYDMDKFEYDKNKRHGYKVSVEFQESRDVYNLNSIASCSKFIHDIYDINIDPSTISKYCNSGIPYKGFLFKFLDNTKLM